MLIGLIHLKLKESSKKQNIEKAKKLIKTAKEKGAKLVVLPSLFPVGNVFEVYENDKKLRSIIRNLAEKIPGPYTNYVRRTIGLEGVLKLMQGVKNRKAYFSTVMCYISESDLKIFEGRVYGKISSEIRGEGGFGFDPIFIPDGEDRTFAEMRIEEKNKYSHRSNAFKKFIDYYLYRKVS
ncbi:hypothetical protein DDW01_00505 [Sulfolobus sp. SCGC AB-777_G05]|nr:hypothetical protein DDW01_00505 [Sulfolobus sp. SCGC AB-777_G05]